MIKMPVYNLLPCRKRGRLRENYTYQTPITGHNLIWGNGQFRCRLYDDGRLTIYAGSIWDFGTWAIDTPAMVYASLPHDAFCLLTNSGVLPWECRMAADKYFGQCLKDAGAPLSVLWRLPLVMLNSQTVARLQRAK